MESLCYYRLICSDSNGCFYIPIFDTACCAHCLGTTNTDVAQSGATQVPVYPSVPRISFYLSLDPANLS